MTLRGMALAVFVSVLVGGLQLGCSVHAGAHVDAAVAGGDCEGNRDACVDECRGEVPDNASRGPCFNQCVRRYDACSAR